MGVDPLRTHLPWMVSTTVLVNPLLQGIPRRGRIQRPSQHEAPFPSHFRGALFCILSADVGSLCIIAAVDFVRDMRSFLSFPVVFLAFFTLYNLPRLRADR